MLNKKLLLIQSIYSLCGIALLMFIRVLLSTNCSVNFLIESFFIIFSIILMVAFLVCYNNEFKKTEVKLLDVVLPIACSLILYVIYLIPPLEFLDVKGANNSVVSIFFFSILGRFCYNMAQYKEMKNRGKRINKKLLSTVKKYDSYYDGLTGTLAIIAGVALSILNLFLGNIDLSFPVQVLFMGKTLAESFT